MEQKNAKKNNWVSRYREKAVSSEKRKTQDTNSTQTPREVHSIKSGADNESAHGTSWGQKKQQTSRPERRVKFDRSA